MPITSGPLSPGRRSWARGFGPISVLTVALLASVSGDAAAQIKALSPSTRPAAQLTALAGPPFVGERDFKRLVRAEVPLVVEFWASWCAPCKYTSRQMATLAAEFGTQATVVRVDVDREPYLAQKYGVQALPTVVVFRAGKEVSRSAGAVGADRLRSLVAPQTPPSGVTFARNAGSPAKVALAVRGERTASSSDSYALVINGDREARHRDNVGIAVDALRRIGYDADRIYVLTTGPAAAASTPAGHPFAPTWKGLKSALKELAERLDGDDIVTVYITGHAVDAPGTPRLLLADTDVAPAELARHLLRLPFGRMIFVADHCFSGAFTRTLQQKAGQDRAVVTVAATDPRHEVECTLFARPFWRALSDAAADHDGDGAVSVEEAFAVAADSLTRSKGKAQTFAELSGTELRVATHFGADRRPDGTVLLAAK